MSDTIVIKDKKKRGMLWLLLIFSWWACCKVADLSDTLMVLAIFNSLILSFLIPYICLVGFDKIKFKNGYMCCKSSERETKYQSFWRISKIPVSEIKLVYLDKLAGLVDVYAYSSERIASIPCLGMLSSKEYFENMKKYFEQKDIKVLLLENNVVKPETLLITDIDAKKNYVALLFSILLVLCICILIKSVLLSEVCIICFIVLNYASLPISRIEIKKGHLICQPLNECVSKYTSLFGVTKLPINDINVVRFNILNDSVDKYSLEFFDSAGHKLAKMLLSRFTSKEYLERLKAKFQSLNIECITNIPFLENEVENAVQSDIPQPEREQQTTIRKRNIPQQVASDNSPVEKKERKRGRHIDLD